MDERRQWFHDRIGKRVFRNKMSCPCPSCTRISNEGVVIDDEMHADYLCDIEADYTAEGSKLRYFDTKEEAVEY